jgi:hypothetical protein
VLDVRRRVLGKDHPATLTSMNNLALTLREQGELGEARPLQERVLDVRIGALGEQHPATLTSMWNLGLTLLDLGEKDTALQLLRRCLAGRRKVLGDQHRSTTATAELLKSVTEEAKLEKSRNQKV